MRRVELMLSFAMLIEREAFNEGALEVKVRTEIERRNMQNR